MKMIYELNGTVDMMLSDDYKVRFKAQYWQTKIRYEKLKDFCNKIEVFETRNPSKCPKHDCDVQMLRQQQEYMGKYLSILEKRALIEDIDLCCIKSNDTEFVHDAM